MPAPTIKRSDAQKMIKAGFKCITYRLEEEKTVIVSKHQEMERAMQHALKHRNLSISMIAACTLED